jgi:hypothetical protein
MGNMAKRTATRTIVRYQPPKQHKAQIIRVSAPRPKKQHHRRGGGGENIEARMKGGAMGGFGVGLIEKQFPNLPTLPVVGKKGAIALAVYFMKPKNKLLRDVGFAAAVLAGYEFGTTGKVSGAAASQMGSVVRQS